MLTAYLITTLTYAAAIACVGVGVVYLLASDLGAWWRREKPTAQQWGESREKNWHDAHQ